MRSWAGAGAPRADDLRALRKRGVSHLPDALAALASMWLSITLPPLAATIGFDFHPPIARDELDAPDADVYAHVEGLLPSTMDARQRVAGRHA